MKRILTLTPTEHRHLRLAVQAAVDWQASLLDAHTGSRSYTQVLARRLDAFKAIQEKVRALSNSASE